MNMEHYAEGGSLSFLGKVDGAPVALERTVYGNSCCYLRVANMAQPTESDPRFERLYRAIGMRLPVGGKIDMGEMNVMRIRVSPEWMNGEEVNEDFVKNLTNIVTQVNSNIANPEPEPKQHPESKQDVFSEVAEDLAEANRRIQRGRGTNDDRELSKLWENILSGKPYRKKDDYFPDPDDDDDEISMYGR